MAKAVQHEWSSRGGKALLAKFGREYFVQLRQRRTHCYKHNEPDRTRPSPRVVAARANGRKGGNRRAEHYGPESLSAMARLGGITTRVRHGSEFFREIRKKRKRYPKGYIIQRTKDRLRQEAIHNAHVETNWAIAELWKAVALQFQHD
jgi:hypothetical protein